jgi:hypothetical protein
VENLDTIQLETIKEQSVNNDPSASASTDRLAKMQKEFDSLQKRYSEMIVLVTAQRKELDTYEHLRNILQAGMSHFLDRDGGNSAFDWIDCTIAAWVGPLEKKTEEHFLGKND